MSETPLTDRVAHFGFGPDDYISRMTCLARKLELTLRAAEELIKATRRCVIAHENGHLGVYGRTLCGKRQAEETYLRLKAELERI